MNFFELSAINLKYKVHLYKTLTRKNIVLCVFNFEIVNETKNTKENRLNSF